jgi:hypothetical protein
MVPETGNPHPVTHPLAVNLGLALWLWYRNHVQPCIAPILGLKRRKMALVQLTLCANIAASAVIRLRRDESPAADGFEGIHDGFVECLTLLSTQRFGALETMYHLYVVQAAKISLERLPRPPPNNNPATAGGGAAGAGGRRNNPYTWGVTSSEQQEQEGVPHRRTATQPQQEGEQQEQEGVATTGTLGTNPTGVTSSEPPTVLNSIMQRGRLIPCHQKAGTRQSWIRSCGPTCGCLATQTASFAIGPLQRNLPLKNRNCASIKW